MLKQMAREVCPPMLWRAAQRARDAIGERRRKRSGGVGSAAAPDQQELAVYWTKEMADILETWGEGNAWREIQLMLGDRSGPILDVACGTGQVMRRLGRFELEVHGIDVSDALIGRAVGNGIPQSRLTVGDATNMPYPDSRFTHAYSIGSLEHFTESGIVACLKECRRVASGATFHLVPTSRSGRNEGWLRRQQSYFNNSIDWWLGLARQAYPRAIDVESSWGDDISVGIWLICRP